MSEADGGRARVALCGGALARVRFGEALPAVPSLQVVALVDPDPRAGRAWARQVGGKPAVFPGLDALLGGGVPLDAILLAAPFAARSAQILAIVRSGHSLLCDLPFGLSLEETDRCLQAVPETALLMPILPRRFDPYFEAANRLLQESVLGEVKQARCDWTLPLADTTADEEEIPETDWPIRLHHLACHSIDACRLWFGNALSVSADIDGLDETDLPQRAGRHAAERVATLLATHERGQVTHHFARVRATYPGESYTLTGTQGRLELILKTGTRLPTGAAPTLLLHRPGQRPEVVPVPETAPRMVRHLEHFAACLRGVESPRCTGQEARADQEVALAAILSALHHTRYALPLLRFPNIDLW